MEWTDYRDALVRGLWLVAVLAIVGAGVGLLLPKTVVHPDWVTTTSVGAPPAVNGVGSPIPSGRFHRSNPVLRRVGRGFHRGRHLGSYR